MTEQIKQAALSRQDAYQLMSSPLADKAFLVVGVSSGGNYDWDNVGYTLHAGDVPLDVLVQYLKRYGGGIETKKEDLTPGTFVESQTKTLTKVLVGYALADGSRIDIELQLKKAKAASKVAMAQRLIRIAKSLMSDAG